MQMISRSVNPPALVWIATADDFRPEVPDGRTRIDLVAPSGTRQVPPEWIGKSYAVIFEASFDAARGFDPVVEAHAVRAAMGRSPEVAVAVVAPTLPVHPLTQHALAYEVGAALNAGTVAAVLLDEPKPPTDGGPVREKVSANGVRPRPTGFERAVEIALGRAAGEPLDGDAVRFAYAYLSRARCRSPFRCTPLQRTILQIVAAGEIVPTTSAIAQKSFAQEKKVREAILDLTDNLAPTHGSGADRDSNQRLYWLMHRYGSWIRLAGLRS
ncbi:hypothetical protein [Nocardia sp. NPDC057353]|uniref:hypothetical protein n=1 Tax=Nocardia sp. NPDC057353 TaxID=3346104 RepID=UPI003628D6CD